MYLEFQKQGKEYGCILYKAIELRDLPLLLTHWRSRLILEIPLLSGQMEHMQKSVSPEEKEAESQ